MYPKLSTTASRETVFGRAEQDDYMGKVILREEYDVARFQAAFISSVVSDFSRQHVLTSLKTLVSLTNVGGMGKGSGKNYKGAGRRRKDGTSPSQMARIPQELSTEEKVLVGKLADAIENREPFYNNIHTLEEVLFEEDATQAISSQSPTRKRRRRKSSVKQKFIQNPTYNRRTPWPTRMYVNGVAAQTVDQALQTECFPATGDFDLVNSLF